MKKKLKKGFTLVELVIVIAVIAILSAILIPTFGNVINNAKESAAKSEVSNAITQYTTNQAQNNLSADLPDGYIVLLKDEKTVSGTDAYKAYVDGNTNNISYVFSYNKGKLEMVNSTNAEIKEITPSGEATATPVLQLTIGSNPVNLKFNGLTPSDDGKTWEAKGTVVLDGTVKGAASPYTISGKIVLLTVVD